MKILFAFVSIFLLFFIVLSCKKDNTSPTELHESMYFPPNSSNDWEKKSFASLGWNESAVQPLKDYLSQKNTKSFMILVNGRIVMEEYFDGFTANDTWQWNSAGKTLISSTIGIAQQEGLLTINQKASVYLGTGWTSESQDKENLITIRNLLTMTSGLDDTKQLVIKSNLTYIADAGTRWAYGNVFQVLADVVANAYHGTFEDYFNQKIKDKIGMDGNWRNGLIFNIYHSNTRSMARFGILALNHGKWKNEQIIDATYFKEAINSSQNLNPSYGYLWWLNGKNNFKVPGSQTTYPGPLVPNAPADMYAAMGAEDQRIYIIPGKNMIVVRMGNASDPNNPSFAVSGFDNALWEKVNALYK